MLSPRLLTSFVTLLWCAAASFAQLPKRLERCLPIPTLAQEIRDMRQEVEPEPQKVTLHVVSVEFDPASKIPKDVQDEISKNEIERTFEMDADSDYLKDAAIEFAEIPVRGALQNAGYFRVLTEAKLTVFKRNGLKIDVVAQVSAEVGDQYRLGEIRFENVDGEKHLAYNPESLREKIPLKRGELFNVEKIREGLGKLTRLYGTDGYIDFAAEPEFKIDDETKIIDLTLRLQSQKQFRIREIEFWGLDPKVERRLRESYQQSGEIFDRSKMDEFFKKNRALLPADADPYQDVTIRRDEPGGTIGILFDFRTCSRMGT